MDALPTTQQCALARVQSQTRLAGVLIRAVALETRAREDRADVAGEADLGLSVVLGRQMELEPLVGLRVDDDARRDESDSKHDHACAGDGHRPKGTAQQPSTTPESAARSRIARQNSPARSISRHHHARGCSARRMRAIGCSMVVVAA